MRKTALPSAVLFLLIHPWFYLCAQITLPYSQGFENAFLLSPENCGETCTMEFIPGWTANEVRATSRVFRDIKNARTGEGALGLTPTATYNPETLVKIEVKEKQKLSFAFYGRSIKNGGLDDLRSSLLYLSWSFDRGLHYSKDMVLDTFKNENGSYKVYKIDIPQSEGEDSLVIVKIQARRADDFTGTAAKIIVDDLSIQGDMITSLNAVSVESDIAIWERPTECIVLSRTMSGRVIGSCGNTFRHFRSTSQIYLPDMKPGLCIIHTDEGKIYKILIEK